MKNIVLKVIVTTVIVTGCILQGKSQVSFFGNNSTNPADFSGWNNTVTFPFQIRHDANQPIIFSTNGDERMRIAQWGNVSVGGVLLANPGPKFAVTLGNLNAAAPPNFESTAIFGANRFSSLGNEINRGFRGGSVVANPESEFSTNMGGSFWGFNANMNFGVFGNASGNEQFNFGDSPFIAGEEGFGVAGVARDHQFTNIALFGRALAHNVFPNAFTCGVFASADGPVGGTDIWAGFFTGEVFLSNGWTPSGANLKQNIQELEGALEVISQLEPKKYNFQTDEYSFMHFPAGEQYGLLAQDLEEVLPSLTRDVSKPSLKDSTGTVVEPALDFKAVNYTGLIPYLVAGMKEQQSIIEAQNEALAGVMDQLNALQSQMDNCCSGDTGYKNMGTGGVEEEQMQKASPNGNVLNQNTPNPFRSQTSISYTLEEGGKVLLNVFDKTGKPITTLVEAEQPADTYRYEWDATGLPAGLYHYALYVDGELLVKKAIKLAE